jgi:leucyl aminopeptidase
MALPPLRPLKLQSRADWTNTSSELCIVVADETDFESGKIKATALQGIDAALGGVVAELAQLKDFEGKWLQSANTLPRESSAAKRVFLVGGGKKNDQLLARARQLGVRIGEELSKSKATQVVVVGSSRLFTEISLAQQMAIGVKLGHYKYPSFNPTEEQKKEMENPVQVSFAHGGLEEAFAKATVLAGFIESCRLLQDGPPNIVNPKYVAENMVEKAKALGLKTEVLGAQALRQKGFNAMMAVAGGSANEPQLVVMEYTPEKYEKTIAFVGKGLTMDTGGYSIKPANSMVGMKYDMSGAAITLNAIQAIAQLKLPVRVIAVGALAENMIDAHAYRVGDVIKTLSGKTIEVMNTDAEGRIVLSDALYHTATEYKPDAIFEYSTLTGAMVVSLGHVGAGLFAFNDDKIASIVETASQNVGEKVWQLPTWEEYGDDIKGQLADFNNVQNTAGSAGSATAAQFLKEFVDGKPFAHIDIAGVADNCQAIGHPKKISSGFGVQLSVEIARLYSAAKV